MMWNFIIIIYFYSTKRMMTHSYGWNLQRLYIYSTRKIIISIDWRIPHSMQSSVCVTVGRPSVRPVDWQQVGKLTIPPSSDARPLQFITGDRQALSTARYGRAGQLATADTCFPEQMDKEHPAVPADPGVYSENGRWNGGGQSVAILCYWIMRLTSGGSAGTGRHRHPQIVARPLN